MTSLNNSSAALAEFICRHPKVVVLSGAGISAASGIPTYRSDAGQWKYSKPIQHQDFIADPHTRKRYWARSLAGWPNVSKARPNSAHAALARLEATTGVELLITQNVDRLHQRAGSLKVIDLHGRLDRVICLDCRDPTERDHLQLWLHRHNTYETADNARVRPDGDSDLSESYVEGFQVPHCLNCGGTLMPDVVFYGGTVPRARVESCIAALNRADALLVIGSSLQVYSGYRFCRHAQANGKPIAILNKGSTRADSMATLKIPQAAEEVLPTLERFLMPT
ncbi:MAG: NAD-dependent protein deacetylase [Halioglobus sp.]